MRRRISRSACALVRPSRVPTGRLGPRRRLTICSPTRHCPYQDSRPRPSARTSNDPVPYERFVTTRTMTGGAAAGPLNVDGRMSSARAPSAQGQCAGSGRACQRAHTAAVRRAPPRRPRRGEQRAARRHRRQSRVARRGTPAPGRPLGEADAALLYKSRKGAQHPPLLSKQALPTADPGRQRGPWGRRYSGRDRSCQRGEVVPR